MVSAEPRGGSQEDFDSVLKGYYDFICRGNKPVVRRKSRIKKVDLNQLKVTEATENSKTEGAAFLAVCRGKVHIFYPRDFGYQIIGILLYSWVVEFHFE